MEDKLDKSEDAIQLSQELDKQELNKMIAKHNIEMDAKPMRNIEGCTDKFLLIRHGFSLHNLIEKETLFEKPIQSRDDPRYHQLHMDTIHLNTPLHQIGIQQCINQRGRINSMEYQAVFVSPLLRTLQTTIYMFGTHPNRDRIKFIVMPEIYECLCSSGCFAPDTLTNIKPKMIAFADKFGIKLDFSRVEELGTFWQIKALEDEKLKEQILNELSSIDKDDLLTYQQIVFKWLESTRSFFLETWQALFQRSRKAISLLKYYQSLNSSNKSDSSEQSSKDQKIAVVSHGFFLKCMTASKIEENGRVNEGAKFDNCQLLPFTFEPNQL